MGTLVRFIFSICFIFILTGSSYSYYFPTEPPARYQSGPFKAPVEEDFLSRKELAIFCKGLNYRYACFRRTRKICRIRYDERLKGTWVFKYTRKHELAHCRGWPSSHPR